MINKNKLGLIDSQDAIIGNPLYDVASLIDDVRIKLPSNLQEKLLNFYYYKSKLKKEEYKNLKNDFEILSVLRNLKIIGIFTRLSLRDKKHKYLKFIPYAWKLIKDRSGELLKNELLIRKKNSLPPFIRLISIIISSKDRNLSLQGAREIKIKLKQIDNLDILGPVDSPLLKIKKNF